MPPPEARPPISAQDLAKLFREPSVIEAIDNRRDGAGIGNTQDGMSADPIENAPTHTGPVKPVTPAEPSIVSD